MRVEKAGPPTSSPDLSPSRLDLRASWPEGCHRGRGGGGGCGRGGRRHKGPRPSTRAATPPCPCGHAAGREIHALEGRGTVGPEGGREGRGRHRTKGRRGGEGVLPDLVGGG
jgi:hypothetical protein